MFFFSSPLKITESQKDAVVTIISSFFFLFRKQLIFFPFLSQRAQKMDFPSLDLFFVINVIDNASVVSAVLGSTV